jgi:hypothetical protein
LTSFCLHRDDSSTHRPSIDATSPHAPRSHLACGMNHRLRVAKKPSPFFLTSHSMPANVSTYAFRLPVDLPPYKQVSLCARKRRLSCASQEFDATTAAGAACACCWCYIPSTTTQTEARNEGLEWRAGGVSRQKGTMRSMRGAFGPKEVFVLEREISKGLSFTSRGRGIVMGAVFPTSPF